jgi:hypothetical protein
MLIAPAPAELSRVGGSEPLGRPSALQLRMERPILREGLLIGFPELLESLHRLTSFGAKPSGARFFLSRFYVTNTVLVLQCSSPGDDILLLSITHKCDPANGWKPVRAWSPRGLSFNLKQSRARRRRTGGWPVVEQLAAIGWIWKQLLDKRQQGSEIHPFPCAQERPSTLDNRLIADHRLI